MKQQQKIEKQNKNNDNDMNNKSNSRKKQRHTLFGVFVYLILYYKVTEEAVFFSSLYSRLYRFDGFTVYFCDFILWVH